MVSRNQYAPDWFVLFAENKAQRNGRSVMDPKVGDTTYNEALFQCLADSRSSLSS